MALPAAARAETQAAASSAAAASTGLHATVADVYQSIGVRPLINARGTFTIISGSTMLPEVRAAMDAAAQKYVHLDELTEAVGARLATLTGAEWGMVSNGCSAGVDARDRRVRGRRQSGSPRPPAEPERLPEGRSHHPDALAQRLRRRPPLRRRPRRRGLDDGGVRGGARPADRDDLHPRRAERGQQSAQRQGDRADREGEGCPDPRRRRGRDPDDSERPPAERRDAGRLQRRQVPARAADRRPAARAQGSGQGGVGPQRAAPRRHARAEGRARKTRSAC